MRISTILVGWALVLLLASSGANDVLEPSGDTKANIVVLTDSTVKGVIAEEKAAFVLFHVPPLP